MIDSLTIILSTAICLFILFRAVRLDRKLPWFGSKEAAADARGVAWSPAWDAAVGAREDPPAGPGEARHPGDGTGRRDA